MESQNKKIDKEVKVFQEGLLTEVPQEVSVELFKAIQRQETLGTDSILKKFAGIHILLTLASLFICHQFGLGFFKYNLALLFNMTGSYLGNLLSGMFLMGFSTSISCLFFLNALDLEEIRKDKIKYLGSMVFFSAVFLGMFGTVDLAGAIVWMTGAGLSANYIFDQAYVYLKTKKD